MRAEQAVNARGLTPFREGLQMTSPEYDLGFIMGYVRYNSSLALVRAT